MQSKINRRLDAVEKVAEAWNSAGIDYAVLHGIEHYPDEVGRDLDVLVSRRDSKRALVVATRTLHEQGYVVASPSPIWGRRVIAAPSGEWADALEIHTITRLPWRAVVVADRPGPTARIGPFAFDEWGSFAKRVVMSIFSDNIQ